MLNHQIKTKKILFSAISLFILLAPFAVFAEWTGAGTPPAGSGLPNKTISQILLQIINWFLGFVALIAVLMLVWGGVRYVTAIGDESKVADAKNIVANAVVGLTIAGIAYAIVAVVVEKWIGK